MSENSFVLNLKFCQGKLLENIAARGMDRDSPGASTILL